MFIRHNYYTKIGQNTFKRLPQIDILKGESKKNLQNGFNISLDCRPPRNNSKDILSWLFQNVLILWYTRT